MAQIIQFPSKASRELNTEEVCRELIKEIFAGRYSSKVQNRAVKNVVFAMEHHWDQPDQISIEIPSELAFTSEQIEGISHLFEKTLFHLRQKVLLRVTAERLQHELEVA